jgi:hypothetical protein
LKADTDERPAPPQAAVRRPTEGATMEPDAAQGTQGVRGGLVGVARGDAVEVSRSAVAVAASKGPATMKQSFVGGVLAGGDASVSQGYATAVAAAGDAKVKQGGAQWLLSAGDVDVEFGGAAVVLAPRVTMRRGFVGLLAARDAQLEDGAKVLLKPTGAAALGAAFGAAFAIVAAVAFVGRRRR